MNPPGGLFLSSFLVVLTSALLAGSAAAQPSRDPANRRERAARLRATGQRHLAAGDPGSAAGYFRDAVGVDPSDAAAYEALGRIYLARGSVGHALEVFSSGLRRRPDAAPLWRAMADALIASGDLDDAAEALRQLVERAPDDPEAHRARGELARRRGAWSEALASCRAVLDLAARGAAVSTEARDEARRLEPALARLTGSVDPARGTVRCGSRDGRSSSPVRRALAGCAP